MYPAYVFGSWLSLSRVNANPCTRTPRPVGKCSGTAFPFFMPYCHAAVYSFSRDLLLVLLAWLLVYAVSASGQSAGSAVAGGCARRNTRAQPACGPKRWNITAKKIKRRGDRRGLGVVKQTRVRDGEEGCWECAIWACLPVCAGQSGPSVSCCLAPPHAAARLRGLVIPFPWRQPGHVSSAWRLHGGAWHRGGRRRRRSWSGLGPCVSAREGERESLRRDKGEVSVRALVSACRVSWDLVPASLLSLRAPVLAACPCPPLWPLPGPGPVACVQGQPSLWVGWGRRNCERHRERERARARGRAR